MEYLNDPDPERRRARDAQFRKIAWDLNKALYPRKEKFGDENDTFCRDNVGGRKIWSLLVSELQGRKNGIGRLVRTFLVDSGASLHLICRSRLTPSECRTIRRMKKSHTRANS